MPRTQFSSPLEGSSYFHPIERNLTYGPLRERLVRLATSMGYEYDSLTEIAVDWSSDQDPNNHVTNPAYPRYASAANVRLVESFAHVMGDRAGEMLSGKGIGPMLKGYTMDLKRPTAYPDSLLVGNRLAEIQADRYFNITTIWSLRQQAVVAEFKGYITFVDFRTGRPVKLAEAGEPYASLHAHIKARVDKANELVVASVAREEGKTKDDGLKKEKSRL